MYDGSTRLLCEICVSLTSIASVHLSAADRLLAAAYPARARARAVKAQNRAEAAEAEAAMDLA
jgi:hypothetical protein